MNRREAFNLLYAMRDDIGTTEVFESLANFLDTDTLSEAVESIARDYDYPIPGEQEDEEE